MTRLEALERVAEAAQGALNAEMAEDRAAMNAALGALSAALIRLDALPAAPQPQPADEAVEAAARALLADDYDLADLDDAMQRATVAIRAYLARRRTTDGAVLVVVPAPKPEHQWIAGPFTFREAAAQDLGRDEGYNAALAAIRASAEPPAEDKGTAHDR